MDRHAARDRRVDPGDELIKENQPRYNMRLKDDKSFPYVAIDTRWRTPLPTSPAAAT